MRKQPNTFVDITHDMGAVAQQERCRDHNFSAGVRPSSELDDVHFNTDFIGRFAKHVPASFFG